MFKPDLEKVKKPEIKFPSSIGSSKKQECFSKTSASTLLTIKSFDCVDHKKMWEILEEMEYNTSWPSSWEICMLVRKQQLELNMEQQIGFK